MTEEASQVGRPEWDRVQRQALLVGVLALIVCAAGVLLDPQQFFRSYLVAYLFWLGIPLGGMAILMLQHLTGGTWGLLLRRPLEAATRTLPLLAVLVLPLLFGLEDLYSWAQPEVVEHDELLQHKQRYLNVHWFLIRNAGYFAIWLGASFLLNRWSWQEDRSADPALARRLRVLSAPGVVLYGLTITFFSIDWAMSLEPHWYSTIYGVMFGTGQVLSAFAFGIVVIVLLSRMPFLSEVLLRAHLRDLGSLLLAFVMLWAYLAFSQYLLIWSANLPEETPWYIRRLDGGWQWLALLLVVFHFALPFLLLLSRNVKGSLRSLGTVAGVVLAMRFVDLFWLIVPAFGPGGHSTSAEAHAGLHVHWLDIAAVAGLGGIWLALYIWQLKRRPLLPLHDPHLLEVLERA